MIKAYTNTGSAQAVTLAGAVVNLLLIAMKFLTGILGHSQALLADAVHSLSDLFTDAVVLFGVRAGQKGPDETHHFGHGRLETLASAIVGLALAATGCYIGIRAGLNIYRHEVYYPTGLALAGAALSIAAKEILYRVTARVGKETRSRAVAANAWHHRSDAMSSVAVLFGVAGAWIHPSWHILDAYATLVVSLFILKVALDVLRGALWEMLDSAPRPEVLDLIRSCALGVEGVRDIHDLRVRTAGGHYLMELHIEVDGDLSVKEGHRVAKAVERCLIEDVEGVGQVIVHVDPAEPDRSPQVAGRKQK
ncbi:MAG: cation transporter [Deltaproteobacteria bacterium]|nr:cation transporter [Deltaproteobacteria bacterium]MBW2017567.1 cation transporter [Deltaproteobacteria bacterium]MBW2130253.1 cation transporter [Deltaproteobacteria bacterium]MBW2302541.1 cation transporter [Deltaproteobacteria bacterium]